MPHVDREVVWEAEEVFSHPDDGLDFYIKLLREPTTGMRMVILEPADNGESFVTKMYLPETPHDAVLHDIDVLLETHRYR